MTQATPKPSTGQRAGSGMSMTRLLRRAITHRPGKLIAVMAALAVGATLASAFLSLYFDLPAKMTSEFRSLGPNILIAPPEAAPGRTAAVTTLPAEQTISRASAAAPGAELLGWLYAVGQVNKKTVVLAGSEPERLATLHPSWKITPVAAPATGGSTTPAGVYAGERAAAQQGWTAESTDQQWVTIDYAGAEHQLPLRGIISTGSAVDDQLILPLTALQQITALDGRISALEAAAPGDAAQVNTVLAALQGELGKSASVRALRPVLESQARIVMKVRGLMLGLTAVVLALVLLSVMTTISGVVLDRAREIGIMKALGGSNGRILRFLMAETSLLALAAALAGYFAGFALARAAAAHIFATSGAAAEGSLLALRADVLVAVMGITLAVALAACALPARQLKQMEPAAILRGE